MIVSEVGRMIRDARDHHVLEAAGKLKRVTFNDRAEMKKLVDPVMIAYAKEIGAEHLVCHLDLAQLAVNGLFEPAVAVPGTPVVQLEHAEPVLDEKLQQRRRPFVTHPLHAWPAVHMHDHRTLLSAPV